MTRHSNNLNHRVNTRRGFSLVELLVVIAIITVLLSILMPSLQGARYATKLTVCQANLHSMGVGIAVYGNEHNGYYPHRTVNESAANPRHHRLADKKNNRTLFDDRPMFAPYFDVSLFDCPLPVARVRRHRQPALLHGARHDALRRRQGLDDRPRS